MSQQPKIFVGGLSRDTTDAGFMNFFTRFGQVTEAMVMRDRATNISRGFGFVTFGDAEAVEKVMAERDGLQLDGRNIDCKRAVPRSEMQQGPPGEAPDRTRKIFVGGLVPATTQEDFRAYFEQYGNVTEAMIMYDSETGRSRGFGFVSFDSEATVDSIITKPHAINEKRVELKKAVPKQRMGGQGYGRGGYDGGRGGYGGGPGYGGYGGGYGGHGGRGGYGGGYGGGYPPYGGGYGGGYGYGAPPQARGYGAAAGGYGAGYAGAPRPQAAYDGRAAAGAAPTADAYGAGYGQQAYGAYPQAAQGYQDASGAYAGYSQDSASAAAPAATGYPAQQGYGYSSYGQQPGVAPDAAARQGARTDTRQSYHPYSRQ